MKLNNIFHAIGAIGCIVGIYGLHNNWLWPVVALIWITGSYVNAWHGHRQTKLIEQLDKERTELIGENIKLEGKLWEAEMKIAKQL
jgi:hypothetical protein